MIACSVASAAGGIVAWFELKGVSVLPRGLCPRTPEVYKAWGEALVVLGSIGGGRGGPKPPRTDNRRHPIRVSLGGSLFSVALLRFAGHS